MDGDTFRDMWAAVAKRSAEYRQAAGPGDKTFFIDLAGLDPDVFRAWHQLADAIGIAINGEVGGHEIADAVMAGDPGWNRHEATEFIAWVRTRDQLWRGLQMPDMGA